MPIRRWAVPAVARSSTGIGALTILISTPVQIVSPKSSPRSWDAPNRSVLDTRWTGRLWGGNLAPMRTWSTWTPYHRFKIENLWPCPFTTVIRWWCERNHCRRRPRNWGSAEMGRYFSRGIEAGTTRPLENSKNLRWGRAQRPIMRIEACSWALTINQPNQYSGKNRLKTLVI